MSHRSSLSKINCLLFDLCCIITFIAKVFCLGNSDCFIGNLNGLIQESNDTFLLLTHDTITRSILLVHDILILIGEIFLLISNNISKLHISIQIFGNCQTRMGRHRTSNCKRSNNHPRGITR